MAIVVVNKSHKIIGIMENPLLPMERLELPEGAETHPAILDYMERGILVDAAKDNSDGVSDFEKDRIAQEAIAKYKAEQEAAAKLKEEELKAVKGMKKAELQTKAAGMGLDVKDDDTVDELREKIIAALTE